MPFPDFDPVAFSLGPLVVRWYALAYLVGLLGGWKWCMVLAARDKTAPRPELFDAFLSWAVVGVIVGGRLGYVLFYNPAQYLAAPLDALKIWHGGMSFHGGLVGVSLAAYAFTRAKNIPLLSFTDLLACVAPIGLGLGRLANFINGELFGRETNVPWGVVFPRGGQVPRHPSQLYEALAEGLILFVVLFFLSRRKGIRERKGFLSGIFLILYGVFRFAIEFFREPDPQLGFLFAGATMGQLLCLPMVALGGFLLVISTKDKRS